MEFQINQITEKVLLWENTEKGGDFSSDVKRIKDLIIKMKREYHEFWEQVKRET